MLNLEIPYPAAVILIALAMDWAYPRHEGLAYLLHPVHLTYDVSQRLFKIMPRSKVAGAVNWILSVLPVASLYAALPLLALPIKGWGLPIFLVLSAIVLKLTFSLRLLVDTATKYNNEGNRSHAQELVRRNVYELDEAHVNSAVIESLAESLVDGFSSPLFYYSVLGLPAALIQRLANTMDSSLGYMDEPYREAGWFSAKVDTVINYLPARIAAFTILAAAALLGRKPSLAAFLRYKRSTQSLNAGYPMAAMAASIGVMLEKKGSYRLGDGALPSREDVDSAIRITLVAASIVVAIACALSMILWIVGWHAMAPLIGN